MMRLWKESAPAPAGPPPAPHPDPAPEARTGPASPPGPDGQGRMEVLRELGLLIQYAGDARPGPGPASARGAAHRPSGHTPLWAYNDPRFAKPFAGDQADQAVFELFPPGLSVEEAATRTRTLVFLGAADTPELRLALSRPDLLTLVFEPDNARLQAFCQGLDLRRMARASALFVGGEAAEVMPFLSAKLTQSLRLLTQPVFFVQEGLEPAFGDFAREVVVQMELLYYRARIYPVEGQWGCRSLPLRPIMRDLFFDQLSNMYGNLTRYVTAGNARFLRGTLAGRTALLVAPGPDMDAKMHYVHKHRHRAVVIAVSRALKPLLAAGITPHFVVVNDNSIDAAKPLQGIPPQPRTVLVAQCLSPLGDDAFGRTFFFGNILPQIFPERADLRLHGSVITAAFSLARLLGCRRCVLVGGQLASYDPWTFGYAKDSAVDLGRPGETSSPARPLIGRYPQLMPMAAASGKTMYTTPNYLDAAVWFREEVKRTGIEVVNACADSILFGDPIRVEENYPIPDGPDGPDVGPAVEAIAQERDPHDLAGIEDFILQQLAAWGNTRRAAENTAEAMRRAASPEPGEKLLSIFDANNTTYLLERFQPPRDVAMRDTDGRERVLAAGTPFFTRWFNETAFPPSPPLDRLYAGLYYFNLCAAMAEVLCGQLSARLTEIRDLRGRFGDRA